MDTTVLAKKTKTTDMLSQLPDELLLRILSFLPSTKDVVETMVLSQRWQFLWTMVPRLAYDYVSQGFSYEKFTRFVDRSLFLHEAPVIEALSFKLGDVPDSKDIRVWIRAAEKRSVRELIIKIVTCESPVELPRSLYRCCRMLVTLKLSNAVLVNDAAYPISFPSLKKLSLKSIKYPSDVFVDKLLSGCPVLEDLVVKQCPGDNVPTMSVRMHHLKSLTLLTKGARAKDETHGFVIDTPSLEFLKIVDHYKGFCVIVNDMSKILKAKVYMNRPQNAHLVGSITSTKRLCLCLPNSKDAYPVGIVFHRLVHLKICTCNTGWLNLLMRVLNDSPNLQSLKLQQYHVIEDAQQRPCWIEPSSVPECVSSSLETLEWVDYGGREEEKDVVAFILRSANSLGNVTISPNYAARGKKLEMIKELSLLPRRSPTCRIAFD